jgi:hypothetical protein
MSKPITYLHIPLPDGNLVIDEWCKCKHKRSAHNDNVEKGHGPCRLCDCGRFVWEDFLAIPNPDLKHG